MKRIIGLLLTSMLILMLCFSARANETASETLLLSQLSEDECITFIIDQGLEIPEELLDYNSLGAFVKYVITVTENEPNHVFTINYPITFDFANQIKEIVNAYYHVSNSTAYSTYASREAYSLQYNTVYGPWLDEYLGYNCYGYAIDQTRPYDSFYLPYYPGCFNPATTNSFSLSMSVEDMANLTISDLTYLGYPCIQKITNYSEAIELSDTHNIICIRKCSTIGKEDYHYMKLSGTHWLHKPGNTHVLSFNTAPYSMNWFNESSYMGVAYNGDRYYTGTIFYIAYGNDHSYSAATYVGEHKHIGAVHLYKFKEICEHCSSSKETWVRVDCDGPPCMLAYSAFSPGNPFTE